MFEDYKPIGSLKTIEERNKTNAPSGAKYKKLNERRMKEHFFEETALIGIVSSYEPYHLCWTINRTMDTQFCCMPDMTIELVHDDDTSVLFPVYQYKIDNSAVSHMLYKLKNGNHLLLQDVSKNKLLSRLDYLWLLQASVPDGEAVIINEQLKQVDGIQLSMILDQGQLKDQLNLLL